MNKKYRLSVIEVYEHLARRILRNMSSNEEDIIKCSNIGTVQDGGRAIYTNELRYLLSVLLTQYYSTENLDKWNGFELFLKTRLADELDYEKEGCRTTEICSKNLATSWVLRSMNATNLISCSKEAKKYEMGISN